ncbi:O-linked-mannose beta-1-2-N-acetylglucosaminyltransferase 1-like 19 [Homarus americanus]|uniref:Alpha-1,3-mannosyl-glycoprotein 2-beta-N-acetylglucosaminyltransferase n=1 Tax=Homarus americanus TaxID=6706 RepID=A0A8J5MYB0_HOMAM|nr:O-linked-mannose beta-1-2-N-acetylglucosaminyltransferase 1-like 19 [Homarus americanus]
MKMIYLLVMMVAIGGVTSLRWEASDISLQRWRKMKELQEDTMSLTVKANHNQVLVLRENTIVYEHEGLENGWGGGVHVVVLHSRTGKLMLARRFRTYQPAERHNLHACLVSLQSGRALILVGQPNFMTFLERKGVEVLVGVGSMLVPRVADGEPWGMITITGHPRGLTLVPGKVLVEAVATKEIGRSSTNLQLQVDLPKASSDGWCGGSWAAQQEAQWRFCDTYEGYGELCRCEGPYTPTTLPTTPPSIPMSEEIPVVIVTANKPYYLYRILKNLKSLAGSKETRVLVVVDGPHRETLELTNVFQVETVTHIPQGQPSHNTRINMNIAFALYSGLNRWPHVDKVILLEDDLILAPDLLRYFHQAALALNLDPTLNFVSAFGQNSYPNTARDSSTVLRAEMYPQYGWMTCRRWVENILPLWVPPGPGRDWDWWLYTEGARAGMEAVVPEVSRTAHGGSAGVHVTGWEQHLFFSTRLLNRRPDVELKHVHRLVAKNYSHWFEDEIRHATKIHLLDHPCHVHVIPKNKTGPFVLYLGVVSRSDQYLSFYLMQACLGTDDQEVKELYEGVIRLRIHPYSHHLTHQARTYNLRDLHAHNVRQVHTLTRQDFTLTMQTEEAWQVLYLGEGTSGDFRRGTYAKQLQ